MKVQLLKQWERLHSSFWFVPAILALSAIVLAVGVVELDKRAAGVLSEWTWLYSGGAEGASAMLETIAGSMITIAGVVFSMTLVALTLASAQFGPRLLRNFMSDVVNQLVLGTFIATFIYCLLVLRTIRREDEDLFVPHLSITLGVLLALVSMAVLIYFIHHVSVSIQADEVVARVAKELDEGIERLFPEQAGKAQSHSHDLEALAMLEREIDHVEAPQDGYLQFLDTEALIRTAVKNDLVIKVTQRPGQYVIASRPLLLVAPAGRLDDEARKALSEAVIVGDQRTPSQDFEFTIGQLVEVAVRALSTGINDPFTALRCADRLGSALYRLAQRPMPSPYWRDKEGRLRIVQTTLGFTAVLDASFNPIRQNAGSSAAVLMRLMEVLAVIAEATTRPEDREAVVKHAELVAGAAGRDLPEADDRAAVNQSLQEVRRLSGAG